MRRITRRNARQSSRPNYSAIVRAVSPYSFIEASAYTADGVTGKVASFPDQVASGTGIRAITADHALVQATSAQQCAIPSGLSIARSRLAATFAAQRYSSNSPASSWNSGHNGDGFTGYIFLSLDTVASQFWLATTYSTPRGFRWGSSGAGGHNITVANGSANIMTRAGGAAMTTSVVYRAKVVFSLAETPDSTISINGSVGDSGDVTGAVSASDADSTLMLGNRPVTLDAPFQGKFLAYVIFAGVATAAQDLAVRRYGELKFGVAS